MVNLNAEILTSISNFLKGKQPRTDVERVVCLAYCLTEFCGLAEVASSDITRLNNEIGLPRLSNPSFAIRKARSRGLLSETERLRLTLTPEAMSVISGLR